MAYVQNRSIMEKAQKTGQLPGRRNQLFLSNNLYLLLFFSSYLKQAYSILRYNIQYVDNNRNNCRRRKTHNYSQDCLFIIINLLIFY